MILMLLSIAELGVVKITFVYMFKLIHEKMFTSFMEGFRALLTLSTI